MTVLKLQIASCFDENNFKFSTRIQSKGLSFDSCYDKSVFVLLLQEKNLKVNFTSRIVYWL